MLRIRAKKHKVCIFPTTQGRSHPKMLTHISFLRLLQELLLTFFTATVFPYKGRSVPVVFAQFIEITVAPKWSNPSVRPLNLSSHSKNIQYAASAQNQQAASQSPWLAALYNNTHRRWGMRPYLHDKLCFWFLCDASHGIFLCAYLIRMRPILLEEMWIHWMQTLFSRGRVGDEEKGHNVGVTLIQALLLPCETLSSCPIRKKICFGLLLLTSGLFSQQR